MTQCDRCGGADGRIEREAHVSLTVCIRNLQKQVADGLNTINGLREERGKATATERARCRAIVLKAMVASGPESTAMFEFAELVDSIDNQDAVGGEHG